MSCQTTALTKGNLRNHRIATRSQPRTNSEQTVASSERRRAKEHEENAPVLFEGSDVESVILSPEEKAELRRQLLLEKAQHRKNSTVRTSPAVEGSPDPACGSSGPIESSATHAEDVSGRRKQRGSNVKKAEAGPPPRLEAWIASLPPVSHQERTLRRSRRIAGLPPLEDPQEQENMSRYDEPKQEVQTKRKPVEEPKQLSRKARKTSKEQATRKKLHTKLEETKTRQTKWKSVEEPSKPGKKRPKTPQAQPTGLRRQAPAAEEEIRKSRRTKK